MEDMSVLPTRYDFSELQSAIQRYVDRGILAGVSYTLLKARDLVDVKCLGWADKEKEIPLRVDHIARIASNTKLITSYAALLLYEEGQFKLDDPIERYIPQLGNRRVLKPEAKDLADTESARSSITIRQLMSHCSGLSHGVFDPGTVLFKAYNARKVLNPGATLAQMMDVLADLPLAFHPGTSFEYSVATDVIGRLIEILSGLRLDEFFRRRIFDRLGMCDTGYVIPEANADRLMAIYRGADPTDPMKPGLTRLDDYPIPGAYLKPIPRLGGSSGLVSTLPDMVALLRSLLPGGSTLLKSETISEMMQNQLPRGIYVRWPGLGENPNLGFGLAGSIILAAGQYDSKAATGEFGWGGFSGTQWWINPRVGMAGLFFTQREMALPHPSYFECKRLAYKALGFEEAVSA